MFYLDTCDENWKNVRRTLAIIILILSIPSIMFGSVLLGFCCLKVSPFTMQNIRKQRRSDSMLLQEVSLVEFTVTPNQLMRFKIAHHFTLNG